MRMVVEVIVTRFQGSQTYFEYATSKGNKNDVILQKLKTLSRHAISIVKSLTNFHYCQQSNRPYREYNDHRET